MKHICEYLRPFRERYYKNWKYPRPTRPGFQTDVYDWQDHLYWGSNEELKDRARALWVNTPGPMKRFAFEFFTQLRKHKIPAYTHTNWRSGALQRQLLEDGYSNTASGPHQRSAAIDVVDPHLHWDTSEEMWKIYETIGKNAAEKAELEITWGGDWRRKPGKIGWDPAHWELKNWRDFPIVEPETSDPRDYEESPFQKQWGRYGA